MARFVAPVASAGQSLGAGLRTDVVVVDAALLVAFVLGTGPHPSAAFLATGVVGASLQELTLDLLVHVTTAALDHGGFVTRRTFLQVALGRTDVVGAGSAARELLTANGFADRDRIEATLAFSLDDGLLTAGTGSDESRGESTIAARAGVADLDAVVILTVQLCVAYLLTAKFGVVQIRHRTSDLLLLLAAVALVLQRFLAIVATSHVAFPLATVNFAVQRLATDRVTSDLLLLAALQRLRHPATSATSLHHRLARRTRSRVTQQRARMITQFLPTANLPARVRHVAPIVHRILQLAAKAEILPRNLLRNVLTGRAAPPVVRLRRIGPLGGAGQVQNVVAVQTRPNRLRRSNQLAAHETLDPARIQLPDQLLALRTLRNHIGLQLLLPGSVPLVSIRTTFSHRLRWRLFTPSINLRLIPGTTPVPEPLGIPLPSATISLLRRRPRTLLLRTSLPRIVKVPPALIPAKVVPSSIIPSLLLLLRSIVLPPSCTTMLLPRRPPIRVLLPSGNKLCRGRLQAGRFHISTTLQGSPAVELRDELLEALMTLLATSGRTGAVGHAGHQGSGSAGTGLCAHSPCTWCC